MAGDNAPFFNLPSLKNMNRYEMDEFLDKEVSLDKFFSKTELEEMGEFEQRRYKNMVQNYQIMLHIGLPAIKPNFMKGPAFRAREETKRKRCKARMSSSDSDDEWTPDMERRKRAKEQKKFPSFLCPSKTRQKPSRLLPKRTKRAAKVEKETVTRESYELRKIRTPNFMNLEPPDDDDFLYCEDCNKDYEGDCPIHGPLVYVLDAEVEEADPDQAIHTLPPDLFVQESRIQGAGLGVFTRAEIPPRTMFGPYGGIEITDPDVAHSSGYCWQIYKDGAPSHFVDARDKAHSNWMRYVNCAQSELEQNLVAFQYRGGIYYRSFKPILPGTELLVWYGEEYARELGIAKEEEELVRPIIVNGDRCYKCDFCHGSFSDMTYWVNHVKSQHSTDKLTAEFSQRLNRWLLTNYTTLKHSGSCMPSKGGEKLPKGLKCITEGVNIFGQKIDKYKKAFGQNIYTEEKPYKCEMCEKSFNQQSHLVTHKRIHTGERPYKCEVCGKSFNNQTNLVQHKRIHTGERPYKCEVCGKSFNNQTNLVQHKRIHTGERPYKCDMCGKSFNQQNILVRHKRTHTGERPYTCEVCGKSFNIHINLVTHKRIHTGERPYKCEECGKSFNQQNVLVTHKRIHTGERPYKCDVCGKSFNVQNHLVTHNRIHTGERPYKCDVCGKSFNVQHHLVTHNRIHTGERPYKCEVCGKSFNVQQVLVDHKRIHTGDKPYKCEVCAKSFNVQHHLVGHMRIHTGTRPYKCEVCGKSFNQQGDLVKHKRIHTGEKPYKCEVCGRSFNRQDNLVTHKKNCTNRL